MINKEKIQARIDGLRKDQEVLKAWEVKQRENGVSIHSDSLLKRKQARSMQTQYGSLERKIVRLQYDHPGLKKIMASCGIPVSKTHTTRVRGWHNVTAGYDLQDGIISINGYGKATFQQIKTALLDEGYIILDEREPSVTIGVGTSSYIRIDEIIK